ncbi:uncharacterized protein LOC123515447 isoform X2 [Portunus trituberculatus]|uniref:uncharacterized protein LOC123515447 isoform X2 n=1 Tax=Portunus trituberculatus TaxID=210409 RepID=UPI001E1D1A86|nr:uncharacterized protein LOC123515447 isoform X2 [Portunus trituberculatus]
MKDTPALLLLLLPLLLPGGFLGSAHAQQCSSAFQTVNHQYNFITTAHRTEGHQTNTTMYVNPERGLRVVLEVEGSDNNYTAEFVLGRYCFPGYWQWWELWVKVKLMRASSMYGQVKTTYKLQVRTNMCVRSCTKTINMQGLVSLHVWASGASRWRLDHPGTHCGTIPQWMAGTYIWTILTCRDGKLPPITTTLPTSTTHATPRTTSPTTKTTSPTPTTTPASPTTTSTTPITLAAHKAIPGNPAATMTGGIVGGVVAGLSVVVAVIVMIVLRRRRGEPTTEDVAMRPQNTESPRGENINSLYEPTYRQEPVYENIGRRESVNSLYGTVERQESVNSLYEPLENFRPTQ